MHIFPGFFNYNGLRVFWKEIYVQQFLDTIERHSEKVAGIYAAHTHHAEPRAPISSYNPSFSKSLVITTSISPIFINNPGYSFLSLDSQGRITDISYRFFQLWQYVLTRQIAFYELHPESQWGIKFSDPSTIRALDQRLLSDSGFFAAFMASKLGFPPFFQEVAKEIFPYASGWFFPKFQRNLVCAMMHLDQKDYEQCAH